MLLLEVLIRELLSVDGLTTRAITTSKVATLEHELGDDAVEGGALVAEALSAGAELTEVLGGLGDDVVVELEADAAVLDWKEVSGLPVLIVDEERVIIANGNREQNWRKRCEATSWIIAGKRTTEVTR